MEEFRAPGSLYDKRATFAVPSRDAASAGEELRKCAQWTSERSFTACPICDSVIKQRLA